MVQGERLNGERFGRRLQKIKVFILVQIRLPFTVHRVPKVTFYRKNYGKTYDINH